ncbi:unnamed protein product, partial [Laminaria digitata]
QEETVETSETPACCDREEPHAGVAGEVLGFSTSYASTDEEGVECPLDWEALAREVEAEWVLDVSENESDVSFPAIAADFSRLSIDSAALDPVDFSGLLKTASAAASDDGQLQRDG